MAKKIYIIAGEASGDLHGANLVKALLRRQPDLEIRAWGGDLMQAAGADVVKHYRDLAFMGFAEVLMNIRTIMRNFEFCRRDISTFDPDAVIFIDYPGFNLRMAKWAHGQNIKTFYYISPQIWAWKQGRVEQIKQFVDRVFCVLPFEKAFYEKFGYKADFVGHPLLDEMNEQYSETEQSIRERLKLGNQPIIALLPGSRKQEIRTKLPVMLEAAAQFPDHLCIIAGAPGQSQEAYAPYLKNNNTRLVFGETYALMRIARAGMITSGTATLEAALFRLPQVVCYKANSISYAIAKRLIKVKFISLVNLILDREAVKELIQHEMTPQRIGEELHGLLNEGHRRQTILADYDQLHHILGGPGASERTATEVLKSL